ncbi:IMPACT family protein [Arthrobacter cryoconiti]|uniref:IMPACT family protein n=1 Tax=Arthrobacter cryoconiti TaxID=748907 RepID=A0ABV8QYX8_9MICC|nr:YigZ family protein [Arthrobacter cryoconiti]MCC9069567.1 YigZ family protein [Arthrobacter cryoconiti]
MSQAPHSPATAASGASRAASIYTTLAAGRDYRSELSIKRSRFITVLRRVDDEAGARVLETELRHEFYGARHHCSALVLGAQREIIRSHDDGEPAGTAGVPMLGSLLKYEAPAREENGAAPNTHLPTAKLSDVCAVVVRYFGGTLLGAGGLVRAYSDSVSGALASASLVRRERLQRFTVALAHGDAGRIENELRSAGYSMTGNSYGAQETKIGFAVADQAAVIDAVADRLASLTGGHANLVPAGSSWVDSPPLG